MISTSMLYTDNAPPRALVSIAGKALMYPGAPCNCSWTMLVAWINDGREIVLQRTGDEESRITLCADDAKDVQSVIYTATHLVMTHGHDVFCWRLSRKKPIVQIGYCDVARALTDVEYCGDA